MSSRLRIILLGALPVGASLLYLLWSYTCKKKNNNQTGQPKNSGQFPSIHIAAVTDVSSKEAQICCSIGTNKTECCSNESIESHSSEIVSKSDTGILLEKKPIVLADNTVTANVNEQPINLSTSLFSDPVEQWSEEPKSSTDVTEHSSIEKDTAQSNEATSFMSVVELKENCDSSNNSVDVGIDPSYAKETCNSVEVIDEIVEPLNYENNSCKPISEECVHVNGIVDSKENCLWADMVSSDSLDCKIDDIETDTINNISIRKDSMGSMSDENSLNSNHDRNDNKCKQNNKKNKNINQQTKDKNESTNKAHVFDFPTEFCGQLIGRRGHNVAQIKEKSGVQIYIRAKVYNVAWQEVTLEGSRQQVNKALDMIRRRFPAKFFPGIDFNRCLPDVPIVPADLMQLTLPSGVSLEVVVCNVVTPNHVFVHQPTHPTFPTLERQTINMRMCYGVEDVPSLPKPVDVGVICAAPLDGNWYRAQIVQTYEDVDECDLKLVDYGGYVHLSTTCLRQIRSDFMLVPFQAIECYLANVVPLKDDEDFAPEAREVLEELVKGCMLQCSVTAIESDGVPYIELTKLTDAGKQAIVINRLLVNRELARWLEM